MVLRWSTSKIVFSDPDLGSKWPPSADIVLTKDPMGKLFKNLLLKPVSQFKANMAWKVLG
jgi:hypothetical protein